MAKKQVKKKSAKRTPVATPPALLAADVFSHLELKTVRLLNSSSSISISNHKVPGKLSTTVQAGFGANLEERTLLSNVSVLGRAFVDHDSDGQSSAELSVTFQCIFNVDDKIDLSMEAFRRDGTAEAILHTAVQIVWPYIRQHIQFVTGSMGLPALAIPLMRFGMLANTKASPEPRD